MPDESDFAEFSDADITDLLDRVQPELRSNFLAMVERLRTQLSADSVMRMMREGRYDEANALIEQAAKLYGDEINNHYILAAEEASAWIKTALDIVMHYDQFSAKAVDYMRQRSLTVLQNIAPDQQANIRRVITDGIARGLNPIEQARNLRENVGLTETQSNAVQNYRNLLESNSSDALDRMLRDRRFDSTVQDAIDTDTPLPKETIDRMVSRYSDRYVAYRAETIARTEAMTAVHAGVNDAIQQLVDASGVDPQFITRQWNATNDNRTRPDHVEMDGQQVEGDEPFQTPEGDDIQFPGDPSAPLDQVINCRCRASTRISIKGIQEAIASDMATADDTADADAEEADAATADEG